MYLKKIILINIKYMFKFKYNNYNIIYAKPIGIKSKIYVYI